MPFLGVLNGFELHSPGPDGKVGTADDVRDPFERVLRSGSPYAKAVEEDWRRQREVRHGSRREHGERVGATVREPVRFELVMPRAREGLGLSGIGYGGWRER